MLEARSHIAVSLHTESPLRTLYLVHLLEAIVNIGAVQENADLHHSESDTAVSEIELLLKPLSLLVSKNFPLDHGSLEDGDDVNSLFRDAWFNIVVHGITLDSRLGRSCARELRCLAKHSRPLIAEERADQLESDLELNTVLRRGMNAQNVALQKKRLIALLPNRESDVRSLTYPKVTFLIAAHTVEILRAESGDCSTALAYFREPSFKGGEMSDCMATIVEMAVGLYLKQSLDGRRERFTAPYVSIQLAQIFAGCCHRIEKVQQVAMSCADRIIAQVPSALCQKSSIFALLELLSIMWSSCLESETDEYEWQSTFSSVRGKVAVELSDNFAMRRRTLERFHQKARIWMTNVLDIASLDIKGLLQTYLSEFDDDGAYGHVSLGRSFALEIGSLIPRSDQRLTAIERHGDSNVNVASDFVAQYTTRQEYRHTDDHFAENEQLPGQTSFGMMDPATAPSVQDAEGVLADLESRTLHGKHVPLGELRAVLRKAASLLCRSKKPQCAIVHHLVGIPFAIFTKHSIKLGISLWLGVIHENPRMESRILTEVALEWEKIVSSKIGIFGNKLQHLDPFYVKEEFAATDREVLARRQQAVHDIIAPHYRIIQFFQSHFNAIRLGSAYTQRTFGRVVSATLAGLMNSVGHPLTREVHFQMILFAITVVRFGTRLDGGKLWRLKDLILSASLRWFAHPPRWSFGGNRLQIKAESQLLGDVELALKGIAHLGSTTKGSLKSLKPKEDLLLMLIESERLRLDVWLFPLDQDRKHHFSAGLSTRSPHEVRIPAT